jgi:hypothetical protein
MFSETALYADSEAQRISTPVRRRVEPDARASHACSNETTPMYRRASLRNHQIPHLRTPTPADARVVGCTGRDRPGDDGIQHKTHDERARRNQIDGSASSRLIERNDETQNLKSRSRQPEESCLSDIYGIEFRNSLGERGRYETRCRRWWNEPIWARRYGLFAMVPIPTRA